MGSPEIQTMRGEGAQARLAKCDNEQARIGWALRETHRGRSEHDGYRFRVRSASEGGRSTHPRYALDCVRELVATFLGGGAGSAAIGPDRINETARRFTPAVFLQLQPT